MEMMATTTINSMSVTPLRFASSLAVVMVLSISDGSNSLNSIRKTFGSSAEF
jgi:hypothetical protein